MHLPVKFSMMGGKKCIFKTIFDHCYDPENSFSSELASVLSWSYSLLFLHKKFKLTFDCQEEHLFAFITQVKVIILFNFFFYQMYSACVASLEK